jgi:DNA processing protein
VPGSPLDPRAAGSNNLLKQGARMVTETGDILEAVRPMLADLTAPASKPLAVQPMPDADAEPADNDRDSILEALGPTPIEVDEIVRFTGLPARTVQVVLLELDLASRIARHAGQRVSLR